MGRYTIVFTREDGSQVLVERWLEGYWTMAERPDSSATWGPPIDGEE
jgi:hypothetical protein